MLRYFLFLLLSSFAIINCGGGEGSESSESSESSKASSNSLATSSISSNDPPMNGAACPANEPCRIMVLGDAIAQGIEAVDGGYTLDGGFRAPLFSMAKNDGYEVTFVGRREDGPQTIDGEPFPRNHEGYSGLEIANLARMIPNPILDAEPHIVLLHIGMAEVYGSNVGAFNTDGFSTELSLLYNIIQDILIKNPNTLVAVSDVISVTGYDDAGKAFANGVSDVVERLNTNISTAKVVLVNHYGNNPPRTKGDDFTHLNDEGYQWMAERWYAAIEPYL